MKFKFGDLNIVRCPFLKSTKVMTELSIDIETYSSADLGSCGVYRYAESPDFAVLLFAYCVDGGAVRCVDLAQGEELPEDVRAALTDPGVTKSAYNANFERVCLSRWLGMPTGSYLDPRQWRCTMVAAARMGLPLGLGECARVLGLSEGKMKEGAALIRYFSKPDGKGRRRLPMDSWDRWETFKEYNIRDVEVADVFVVLGELKGRSGLSVGQMFQQRFAHLGFALILFVSALGVLLRLLQAALHQLDVRQDQLQIQRLRVAAGIGLLQKQLVVFKAAYHMHKRIHLPDGLQIGVAAAAALFDAHNVHEFDGSRRIFLRMIVVSQPVQPLVRHLSLADIRLYSGVGVAAGLRMGTGQRIEQRCFSNIGQSYDS